MMKQIITVLVLCFSLYGQDTIEELNGRTSLGTLIDITDYHIVFLLDGNETPSKFRKMSIRHVKRSDGSTAFINTVTETANEPPPQYSGEPVQSSRSGHFVIGLMNGIKYQVERIDGVTIDTLYHNQVSRPITIWLWSPKVTARSLPLSEIRYLKHYRVHPYLVFALLLPTPFFGAGISTNIAIGIFGRYDVGGGIAWPIGLIGGPIAVYRGLVTTIKLQDKSPSEKQQIIQDKILKSKH